MGRGDPAEWLWRHPVWIRLPLDVRHEWWCCLLALTKDRCGEDLSCCADTGHRRQRLAEGERGSAGWLSPAAKTCYRTGALFPAAPAHLLHPGKQVDLASVFGKRVWRPSRVWQAENGARASRRCTTKPQLLPLTPETYYSTTRAARAQLLIRCDWPTGRWPYIGDMVPLAL
jgi:hypothetical protein